MAIDLTRLEKKFIDLFANVTQEEFEQWLLTKTKPMAQQTAVDWLEDVYNTQGHILPSQFEQAKQMEREQIEKAWWAGHDARNETIIHPSEDCNGYYTQTYGK